MSNTSLLISSCLLSGNCQERVTSTEVHHTWCLLWLPRRPSALFRYLMHSTSPDTPVACPKPKTMSFSSRYKCLTCGEGKWMFLNVMIPLFKDFRRPQPWFVRVITRDSLRGVEQLGRLIFVTLPPQLFTKKKKKKNIFTV
jgi:hypothetical protein